MLYGRSVQLAGFPARQVRRSNGGIATPLSRITSTAAPFSGANRNCATDLARRFRKRMVVTKPVCTPVPPVANGSAAGGAGFAPPASALSVMASRRLAASGTIFFDFKPFTTGKSAHTSRPRAAHGVDFPARAHLSGPDCRLGPAGCLAPKRTLRDRSPVSRPGTGELAHPSR